MRDLATLAFFAMLPGCLLVAVMAKPRLATTSALKSDFLATEMSPTRIALSVVVLACLIPFSLWAFSTGEIAWIIVGCVMTSLAAGMALYNLLGVAGVLAVSFALAIALFASGTLDMVSTNLLAFFAAIGCAQVIGSSINKKTLTVMLLAFMCIDCLIVYHSLASNAVDSLMYMPAGLGDFTYEKPVFNRLTINDQVLGSIDIAYVLLVGVVFTRNAASRTEWVSAILIVTALQVATVAYVFSMSSSLPATVPAGVALLVFTGVRLYRDHRGHTISGRLAQTP